MCLVDQYIFLHLMSYDPYRGVPPKHDPTVEALANYRDNLHKNFRFSKANIARLLALGILFPFFSWTATQMFLVSYLHSYFYFLNFRE